MEAAPGASRMPRENFRRSRTKTYLTAIIESAETDEAGRRFRERIAQENGDEEGAPED
jgi:hypothetical protein